MKEKLDDEIETKIDEAIEEKIESSLGVEKISANAKDENRVARWFDENIEHKIWHMKFFAFIAVAFSLLVAIGLMLYGAYEAIHLFEAFVDAAPADEIQLKTLGVVDMFLFGMVMMIFAFGSYNLFVSKIDNVGRDMRTREIRPKWVRVENFGELKSIFIKVVIMILIITFLEMVVTNADKFKEDIYSLLIVPIGILLISYSLKLLHENEKHEEKEKEK